MKEFWSKLKKWQKIVLVISLLVIVGVSSLPEVPPTPEEEAAAKAQAKQERIDIAIREAQISLQTKIVSRLNDPKSFDLLETKGFVVGDSSLVVGIEFTASNAFGGKVRRAIQAEATLDGVVTKIFGGEDLGL